MRSNDDNFEFDNYEDENCRWIKNRRINWWKQRWRYRNRNYWWIAIVQIWYREANEDNKDVSLNTIKPIVIKKKKSEVEEEPEAEEEPEIEEEPEVEEESDIEAKPEAEEESEVEEEAEAEEEPEVEEELEIEEEPATIKTIIKKK